MPDVFISYAREDMEVAKRLYKDLCVRNVIVWLDLEDLLGGAKWEAEIPSIIRKSKFVLVLLSLTSVSKRGYMQREIKEALEVLGELPESEIYIVPVRIEECESRYERLASLHWIDLFPSYEDGLMKILQTLSVDEELKRRIEEARHLHVEDKDEMPNIYSDFLNLAGEIFLETYNVASLIEQGPASQDIAQRYLERAREKSARLQSMMPEMEFVASSALRQVAEEILATISNWGIAEMMLRLDLPEDRRVKTIEAMKSMNRDLFLKELRTRFIKLARMERHKRREDRWD